MNLRVCTTATDDNLTTLEDVKDSLGITDSKDNETLKRIMVRAARRIESFVGRKLNVQVYQAVLPAYGRKRLALPAYPVRHVFRLFDGTDTGTAAELSATEYTLDAENGFIERNEGFAWTLQTIPGVISFPEPDQEFGRYLVEFSAGYIPPSGSTSTQDGTTSTGSTVEPDIQDACISLVRNIWSARKQASNVTSKKVGDLSIAYSSNTNELPDDVLAILTPYRSII